MNCRLVVVSCFARRPIQEAWKAFQELNWPDCPLPIDIIAPEIDVGWNANLIEHLAGVRESFILLMLDDHFIDKAEDGESWSENVKSILRLMELHPDIGMIKLQAGNAWPPELPVVGWVGWDRLREYDRRHHPFKRTNLVPTLFRKTWLQRLSGRVLAECGTPRDQGRNGALEFEVIGTLLTEDAKVWPERMLGIHRPEGAEAFSILTCMDNDAVREGRLKAHLVPVLTSMGIGLDGFL